MGKKRVLFLAQHFITLYSFRRELIERLCKEGHEVYLSLPEAIDNKYFEDLGCKIVPTNIDRRGVNPVKDLKLIAFYKKMIPQIDPDIIFSYTIKPNVYGGMVCASLKIPYIANVTGIGNAMVNGGIIQKIVRFLYKYGLRKAEKIFFQNEENMKLFERMGAIRGNAELIPGSGVNLSHHTPTEYPEEDGGVKFLFLGRIMKAKGVDELSAAIKAVHEKYPTATLDIVGGLDGDYEEKMKELDALDYVKYHGRQMDVRPFIRQSHCTVLPSYHEGMANVLLESSATARPVIATTVPGCRETFDDGVTGIACEVKNSESLALAMIKFIELPHETKREMGKAARQKVEREYDRNIVVNAYLDTVNSLTEGKKEI